MENTIGKRLIYLRFLTTDYCGFGSININTYRLSSTIGIIKYVIYIANFHLMFSSIFSSLFAHKNHVVRGPKQRETNKNIELLGQHDYQQTSFTTN